MLPCQIQPWASHTAATVFRAPSQKSVSYAWRNRCLKEGNIKSVTSLNGIINAYKFRVEKIYREETTWKMLAQMGKI
jgi:hypothetical protein